jgi:subtilisin family serine protease
MKKIITLATLLQLASANASVVAIMDSGTDISHKDLAPKVWTNKNEKVGSKTDLDGSGLPGDVNGWDFTEMKANPFNDKYNYLLTADVKKFYSIYAKYELKTITKEETEWLKAVVADKKVMNVVNFIGGYAHGTHVAGIAALNNPKAQVMGLKLLPTVFAELPVDKASAPKEPVQLEFDFAPVKTIADFKKEVSDSALEQVQGMIPINGYLDFHKVDVVNQSFGIGFMRAAEMLQGEFISAFKREPTQDELMDVLVTYFTVILQTGPEMFKAAPNTLFIVAAGNDTSDNDALPDYPASIKAPNKIVVAATNGYSELAEFSNFGAVKVDVAAPGVAIESTSPTQSYLHMSGTSQAAPFVTNAVALAKDINPALKAADIKSIILKTVDVKDWLKGKVATSGIVNKARVARAAELSKTMNVEVAISKAKAEIADVATQKSFARRLPGMKVDFKPIRPSLMIKLPTL